MSYVDRITERIGMYIDTINGGDDATASQEITSEAIDMEDVRQIAYLLANQGTGTVNGTIQYGVLTTATAGGTAIGNKYGYTFGDAATDATYATLTVGTSAQTYQIDSETDNALAIEIDSESLPANTKYLRAIVNSGTAQTFATLVTLTGNERYKPVTHDSDITSAVETEIAE
jgi:hypothetical protein